MNNEELIKCYEKKNKKLVSEKIKICSSFIGYDQFLNVKNPSDIIRILKGSLIINYCNYLEECDVEHFAILKYIELLKDPYFLELIKDEPNLMLNVYINYSSLDFSRIEHYKKFNNFLDNVLIKYDLKDLPKFMPRLDRFEVKSALNDIDIQLKKVKKIK